MTVQVSYTNFCDLEDKVDRLYDTFNHVEWLRDCGDNRAEYFCTM